MQEDGSLVEGGDAFSRAVQLMQECALLDKGSGVGALALTFRAPSLGDVGGGEWEEEEEVLMGAEDAALWAQVEAAARRSRDREGLHGAVLEDLHTKLMENVDRRYVFSSLLIFLFFHYKRVQTEIDVNT